MKDTFPLELCWKEFFPRRDKFSQYPGSYEIIYDNARMHKDAQFGHVRVASSFYRHSRPRRLLNRLFFYTIMPSREEHEQIYCDKFIAATEIPKI